MAYEIVEYGEEHEGAVAELERALWLDDVAANVAQLGWKYRATPLREHSRMFVALTEGRVVGVRGFVGGRWQARRDRAAGDVDFVALAAADLVISPEHRNSGLYRQLNETAVERVATDGYPLVFNFSAGPANRIASLAAGWRQAFPIERWVRNARPAVAAKIGVVVRRGFGVGRDPLERFEHRRERSAIGPYGTLSVRHLPRAADMAALVARLPWDGRIRQRRDEEFFQWRFSGPMAVNRFVYCDEGDTMRGYLVMQARRHRAGAVSIVDFEAETTEILAVLVETGVRWAEDQHMDLWADGAGFPLAEQLSQAGWRAVAVARGAAATGPALLLRRLDPAAVLALEAAVGRRIGDAADWDLRPAYSDAY